MLMFYDEALVNSTGAEFVDLLQDDTAVRVYIADRIASSCSLSVVSEGNQRGESI